MGEIFRIAIGCIGIVIGVILFRSAFKKSQRIDTESVAVVKEVRDLGREDLRKVYAIKYIVQAKEPFELLESPSKKARHIGKERSVFYEKADPSHNYYFKTIGQFDRRFVIPCSLIIACILLIVSVITNM